jgi:hypothetical protein
VFNRVALLRLEGGQEAVDSGGGEHEFATGEDHECGFGVHLAARAGDGGEVGEWALTTLVCAVQAGFRRGARAEVDSLCSDASIALVLIKKWM